MTMQAQNTLERSIEFYPFLASWEPTTKGGWSENQLIDAYLLGKEHAKTEELRILRRTFEQNLKRAMTFSEEKFRDLHKKFQIRPVAMRLKIESISAFEVLFILKETDYKADNIKDVYRFLLDETGKVTSEGFNWSFIIMPSVDGINEEAITYDGYSLIYAAKPRN